MSKITESINVALEKLRDWDQPGSGGIASSGVKKIAAGIRAGLSGIADDMAQQRKALTSAPKDADPEQLKLALENIATNVGPVGVMGQLKGVAPEIARRIRAVMKAQQRVRQKTRATPGSEQRGEIEEMIDALAGSTTWRNFGSGSGPDSPSGFPDKFYVGSRLPIGKGTTHGSSFNVGEPWGVSTTFDPKFAESFRRAPINRILNLYSARPSDVIVQGWKGSKHEGVLQDAYLHALARQDPNKLKKVLNRRVDTTFQGGNYSIDQFTDEVEALTKAGKDFDTAFKEVSNRVKRKTTVGIDVNKLEDVINRDDFGRLMNEYFQSRGFEGIIYSPNRFKGHGLEAGEAEIKMFDPKRVVPLERTREGMSDPVVRRLRNQGGLTEIFLDGTVNTIRESGVRNPAIRQYADKLSYTPGSLGSIYEGIDSDQIRRALREGAKGRSQFAKQRRAEREENLKFWDSIEASEEGFAKNFKEFVGPKHFPIWDAFDEISSVKAHHKAKEILDTIPKAAHDQYFKILDQIDSKSPKQIVDELTNWFETSFI